MLKQILRLLNIVTILKFLLAGSLRLDRVFG